jgi:hypothetical protein
MEGDSCGVCGGDGRISNSLGGKSTTCPACHGTGRSSRGEPLMRDVTKTKPSHYGAPTKAQAAPRPTFPTTAEGGKLGNEVQSSAVCSNETKARLVREIIEYEETHGQCTKTFVRKIRKQLRPSSS